MSDFYVRGYRKRKWSDLNGEELDKELSKLTTKPDALRRFIERKGVLRLNQVWFATAEGLETQRHKQRLRRAIRTLNVIADAELGERQRGSF